MSLKITKIHKGNNACMNNPTVFFPTPSKVILTSKLSVSHQMPMPSQKSALVINKTGKSPALPK